MTATTTHQDLVMGYQMDNPMPIEAFVRMAPDSSVASLVHADLQVRSITPRTTRSVSVPKKVLRRMHGFLIEVVGSEAKVGFVDGNNTHEYYLPASQLTRSGITAENQPFEMTEIEMKTDGGMIVGYEFRALAQPSDAFPDSFGLDPDRERKRDLIFDTFRNAKD